MSSKQQLELDLSNISRVYYFNIGEDFSQKLVNRFLELLNSISPLDRVDIFISSCGGDVAALFVFLDIINSDPARFTIVISGICDSASLNLTLMSDCDKKFLPGFIGGVLHSVGSNAHTRDLEDPDSDTSIRTKEYKKMSVTIFNYFNKLNISKDLTDKAKQGKDVFITRVEVIKAARFKEKNNIKFTG